MKKYEPIDEKTERIGSEIVDAVFRIHKKVGPGLLEQIYQDCLAIELRRRGLRFERESAVQLEYDDEILNTFLRLDFLVEDQVVVEVKAASHHPVFEAQLITYLKLTGCRLGYLVNFKVPRLKDGIRRRVN